MAVRLVQGPTVMRTQIKTAGDEKPTTPLLRQCAAETVDALPAELRRRPIVRPEWLSLQHAALYCGYSERQFSEFVKGGIAPPSVLCSRNARRFKRSDVTGGPSQFKEKEADHRIQREWMHRSSHPPLLLSSDDLR
jgi:hypothetical protein